MNYRLNRYNEVHDSQKETKKPNKVDEKPFEE